MNEENESPIQQIIQALQDIADNTAVAKEIAELLEDDDFEED